MLGNKIQKLRKENNLTQEELAEKVDVARQTISKWELGETSPDIKQTKKLARIFKVSLDELTDNDIKDILVEKTSNIGVHEYIIMFFLGISILVYYFLCYILIKG